MKVVFRVQLCVTCLSSAAIQFCFRVAQLVPEVTKECQIMVIIRLYKKHSFIEFFFIMTVNCFTLGEGTSFYVSHSCHLLELLVEEDNRC